MCTLHDLARTTLLASATLLTAGCATETPTAAVDDPTVTTAAVGVAGGTVTSPDGALELVIPAGALGETVEITVRRVQPESLDPELIEPGRAVDVFELGPDGLAFDAPVRARLRVAAPDVPDGLASTIPLLLSVSGGSVSALDGLALEPGAASGEAILTGELRHFSQIVHMEDGLGVVVFDIPEMVEVDRQFSIEFQVLVDDVAGASPSQAIDVTEASEAPLFVDPVSLGNIRRTPRARGTAYDGVFFYRCAAPGEATLVLEFLIDLPGDELAVAGVSLSTTILCKPPPPDPELTIEFTGDGSGRVTSEPPGIDCASDEACFARFPEGTVVTLTATPDEGSTFCGWTGGGGQTESSPVIQVTVDEDGSVTACFGREDDDGTGTPPPSASLIELDAREISFEHVRNETKCPQPIGTVTITNTSAEPVDWALDTGSGAIDAAPASGALPPGESVTVALEFNCTTTQSFTATASVTATAADGTTETEEITINANIR